jgi:CDP-paratose 2-epimerase
LVGRFTGRKTDVLFLDCRQGVQRWYVYDTRTATNALGLQPARPWREGVVALAEWLESERVPQIKAEPALASAAE